MLGSPILGNMVRWGGFGLGGWNGVGLGGAGEWGGVTADVGAG